MSSVVENWIQIPECIWVNLLKPSTSFQPMKFREAGFSNETLQYSSHRWTASKIEQSFGTSEIFVQQVDPLPGPILCPAVVYSVVKFMTVANGDTLGLIMPVRAECCSSTGSACPSSASLVPPSPINTYQPGVATSLLYSGSQFRGYQKSKGNSYDVEVVLQVMSYWHELVWLFNICFFIVICKVSQIC